MCELKNQEEERKKTAALAARLTLEGRTFSFAVLLAGEIFVSSRALTAARRVSGRAVVCFAADISTLSFVESVGERKQP